jgi:hypothetical protein
MYIASLSKSVTRRDIGKIFPPGGKLDEGLMLIGRKKKENVKEKVPVKYARKMECPVL